MRLTVPLWCVLTAVALALPGSAAAWDYLYDGSALPNDSSLGTGKWGTYSGSDVSATATDGSVLHIVDSRTDMSAYFYRFAISGSEPVTAEARVRLQPGARRRLPGASGRVGRATPTAARSAAARGLTADS